MNQVGWFEVYVEDMPRAVAFYNAVFDTQLEFYPAEGGDLEMWMFPFTPGAPNAGGALVKSDFNGPSDKGTLVYFSCDDCAVEEARAAQAGAQVVMPKMAIGENGFVSLIKDSEGNTIGLHSLK